MGIGKVIHNNKSSSANKAIMEELAQLWDSIGAISDKETDAGNIQMDKMQEGSPSVRQVLTATEAGQFLMSLAGEDGTLTPQFGMATAGMIGYNNAALPDACDINAAIGKILADKANISSPAFAGTPTAPTPVQTINNTQLATTAYTRTALSAAGVSGSVNAQNGGNANDIVETFYRFVFNMANTPAAYGFLETKHFDGAGFSPSAGVGGNLLQIFYAWDTDQIFTRRATNKNAKNWTAWRLITTVPAAGYGSLTWSSLPLIGGAGGTLYYTRLNGIVYIRNVITLPATSDNKQIGTMPAGYRPKSTMVVGMIVGGLNYSNFSILTLNSDGGVWINKLQNIEIPAGSYSVGGNYAAEQ